MAKIQITVTGTDLSVSVDHALTAGMTGVVYAVKYDPSWDGLGKVIVFSNGTLFRNAVDGTVPFEVLAEPMKQLRVGIVGRRPDGSVVIPTVWGNVGFILEGAEESADPTLEPENPVWAQSAAMAQTALDTAQALRDRADRGEFRGEPGISYVHSEEFSALSQQVRADARLARQNAEAASASSLTASEASHAASDAEGQALSHARSARDAQTDARKAAEAADAAHLSAENQAKQANDALLAARQSRDEALSGARQAKTEALRAAAEADRVSSTVSGGPFTEKIFGCLNDYDPAAQTPQTIAPHYYVDGKPFSSTQFDTIFNCTDFIPVLPETRYTLTCAENAEGTRVPWAAAGYGVHFYRLKTDDSFISSTDQSEFVTPPGTGYIRFNYGIGYGITLDILNHSCVLSRSGLPDRYYPHFDREHSLYDLVVRSSSAGNRIFYRKVSESELWIIYPYSSLQNACIVLKRRGGNQLFDFSSINTVSRSLVPENITVRDFHVLVPDSGDWHSPFVAAADRNADGDNPESFHFTGGNHQFNNLAQGSTPTARCVSLKFYADGDEITRPFGFAEHLELVWVNRVQGFNTARADGNGREILTETHRLTFDGRVFSSVCEINALEDITLSYWFGFQCFGLDSVYKNVRFIGAANRRPFDGSAITTDEYCGSPHCGGLTGTDGVNRFCLTIDTDYDFCRDGFYEGLNKMYVVPRWGKGYCNFVDTRKLQIKAGETYGIRGTYRFTGEK